MKLRRVILYKLYIYYIIIQKNSISLLNAKLIDHDIERKCIIV